MTWNSVERITFSNISATPASFTLRGGSYGVTVSSTTFGGGTATLQRQSVDGTFITCLTAFSASGYASVNLLAGTYQLLIAGGATAVSADITSIVTTM
jgi:hypothetical protein